MALFTDSDIVDTDTLLQIDSEVSAVAKALRQITPIDGPGSYCEQAWQECGRKILKAMQAYDCYPGGAGLAAHNAAITSVGVPARTQSRVRLNQIVATESQYAAMKSPIEHWLAYTALYLFFRDAAARTADDRYQKKLERYQEIANTAWAGIKSEGLPMVYYPMETPGAKHSQNAGTWSDQNLSAVSGGSLTEPVGYRVAVTYCDTGRGYTSQALSGNAESAPSAPSAIVLSIGQRLHVDISSLLPPDGTATQGGLSQGLWQPLNATHWNLWVGAQDGPIYLQRELIPIATKAATLAGDPVLSGLIVRGGQWPDTNLVFMNLVMRG